MGRRARVSWVGKELNGKWTLLRVIGAGGASTVYEAEHRNGRRAAVKVMFSRSGERGGSAHLAAREACLTNAVGHPGVVDVLDDDVAEDGTPYLVMELLVGETLEDRRRRAGGALRPGEAVALLEQLLDVLAAAHDRGVVHRDIKPENVFVTSSGRLKVLDFGLAADAREEQEGPWFGTPGFMPPEQARAEWSAVDALSDQWAAAATFFTVATGRLVHPHATRTALVRAAVFDEPDLRPLETAAPTQIVDVVQRALSRDRADRWPNTRAMLAALRVAVKAATFGQPPRPRKIPPVPRCQSTTRIFLVRGRADDDAGCPEGITCLMCPVCVIDTQASAKAAVPVTLPQVSGSRR